MQNYLNQNIFSEYKNSYIYIERKLLNGKIRKGILGAIDLENYNYLPGSNSPVRATELTVTERIPPRKLIRENACLELSHVIMLCDDYEFNLIEPFGKIKNNLTKIYDFDLMLNGGNIKGWLVNGVEAENFNLRLQNYINKNKKISKSENLIFAIGDGNHSLATAKACYEDNKNILNRYAMVELENLHDENLLFEPIHRLVKNIDPEKFLNDIKGICDDKNYYPVKFYYKNISGTLNLNKDLGESALHVLQNYLDQNKFEIDYIHDLPALKNLSSQNNNIGFELPEFNAEAKLKFFDLISRSGTLPRKTFSMGHAQEKRYYLEARRIK